MRECTLNEFDLLTLLTEVERILNDRPITRLLSEPDDLAALTPSMLLTGCLGDGAPPGVFLKAYGYRRSWCKTQYLVDLFWERWLKEYLYLLQPRSKWHGSSPSLKPGEVVLIKDEHRKRSCWPKEVVESAVPGPDGLVRRARIITARGLLDRDIRKLCLLEGVGDVDNMN